MKQRYLEITYRDGRPLAGYLYLPRDARAKFHRTIEAPGGLVVDLTRAGQPIGVEITSPAIASLRAMNRVLKSLGVAPMTRAEWAPFRAA